MKAQKYELAVHEKSLRQKNDDLWIVIKQKEDENTKMIKKKENSTKILNKLKARVLDVKKKLVSENEPFWCSWEH